MLGAFALIGWIISLLRKDVSIVDSMWSLMFLIATGTYVLMADPPGPRTALLTILVAIWAVRLAVYITWRNWGEEEDCQVSENSRQQLAELRVQKPVHRVRTAGSPGLGHFDTIAGRGPW